MKRIMLLSWMFMGMLVSKPIWIRAGEANVPPEAKQLTSFYFVQLTGGVILVRATLDNHPDSLNFILDTGSGGISLDSATVEELKIPTEETERTIRGIAGMRKVSFAYNHTLNLPGLSTDSLNFHINNYELLSAVYGFRVDGIIGYSFLRRYIVRIDYDSLRIDVLTHGSYKYPKGGHMLNPIIAGLPMQGAQLRDEEKYNARFFLDTGAGLCLLLSEQFCQDSTLIPEKRKRFNTVTEGLGGKKEMQMTVLKQFRLGPYKFRKVPTYIFADDYNVTAYPYLAGLIGNDLLRRFNVVINYATREFHLLPNSHIHDQFDYSYTGMGLYAIGSDIVISDVVVGSPADEAGLKAGDVVVGMNNNISNNITAYKGILQLTGSKVKMIIRRDGQLFETRMNVKSIL